MKLDVDQTLVPANERLSEQLIEHIETAVNEMAKTKEGTIAVSFVSDQEIQRLNRMYRGKDSVTDVLSFGYEGVDVEMDLIGDVTIAIDQARRQATNDDIELELTDLLIHGILHALGYDHIDPEDAKEMFPIQDAIVEKVL